MRRKGPNVCPQCGERVSMFAAGCAICGAKLDPHRADRKGTVASKLVRSLRKRAIDARPRPDG